MKKTIVFAFLILSVLLAACSSTKSTPTAQPTTIPATQAAEEPTAALVEQVSASEQSLIGTSWMWVAFTDPVQQFNVENPASYTLTFQADGTVNIKADCNNATGAYTVDGQSITIEVGAMTRSMCPPEPRSDDFIKYLGFAAIYFFKDGVWLNDCSNSRGSGKDRTLPARVDRRHLGNRTRIANVLGPHPPKGKARTGVPPAAGQRANRVM